MLLKSCAVLVFAKSPLPGKVKTRLAKGIGARNATRIYKMMLYELLSKLNRCSDHQLELWCYPDAKHPFFRKCARDFDLVLKKQSHGDLGSKMNNAFRSSLKKYESCVLLGSDIPGIDHDDIHQARQFLSQGSDVVILPTGDGGYGLIAADQCVPALFRNMSWSTSTVMKNTLLRAKKNNIKYRLLNEKVDIDTIDDWRQYKLML